MGENEKAIEILEQGFALTQSGEIAAGLAGLIKTAQEPKAESELEQEQETTNKLPEYVAITMAFKDTNGLPCEPEILSISFFVDRNEMLSNGTPIELENPITDRNNYSEAISEEYIENISYQDGVLSFAIHPQKSGSFLRVHFRLSQEINRTGVGGQGIEIIPNMTAYHDIIELYDESERYGYRLVENVRMINGLEYKEVITHDKEGDAKQERTYYD